jgi:hypothetical protein
MGFKGIRLFIGAALAVLIAAGAVQAYEPIKQTTDKLGDAYAELVQVWMAKPANFEALAEKYSPVLEGYVAASDKRFGTKLNQEIKAALTEGSAGKNAAGNRQVIQKGIQLAFINNFKAGLDLFATGKPEPATLGQLQESSPIILSIAGRRDAWLEKGTEFRDAFNAMFSKLAKAAENKGAESAASAALQTKAFANKMTLLSTLYELDGLAKARGTDEGKVAEKLMEARYYYRGFQDEHKLRNPLAAATAWSQLSSPADQIEVELVQKILAQDFKAELAGLDAKKLGI